MPHVCGDEPMVAVLNEIRNQKKNSRNKAKEGVDYFPTPEAVGFKMVEWLG